MALIDKASLLMVPSTYEQEKLYNVLPSGNRAPDNKGGAGYDQTRADFTFDRGSNAAATRIGSDGLIKKYRENKLLQSNQFDTTWANSDTTETSGQSGYDGTNNAWLLTKSAADGYIYQNISQSGVQTYSVYLKANALNWARVQLNGSGADKYAYFDLANGVIGGSGSGNIDENIESIGNGWYRCSIVADTTSTRVRIYPAQADNDVSGTTGSIYIQNAQLESGLVATEYLDSGATTAKAGVLIDLPRINYDANGENGALLLEPQRANAIQYSEYFGASYWTKSGDVTLASNYGISPEGVQNADRIVANATSGGHIVYRNISTTGTHTISIFAKASGYNHIFFGYDGGNLNFGIVFNLSNGTISQNPSNLTGSIEAVGSNGWYRCNLTFNYSTTNYYFVAAPHDNSGSYTWTGNGTDGILIYGAQIEYNASYPTSYIPNHGESGGVTRAADSCSVTGVSDVIGQSEGTLFAEFEILTTGEDMVIMNLYNETTPANSIYFYLNSSNVLLAYVDNSGTQASPSSGVLTKGVYKAAIAYKANDFAFYINGSLVGSDVSGSVPTCGAIRMENYNATPTYQEKTAIKQMALFQERLSNAELATLTTL